MTKKRPLSQILQKKRRELNLTLEEASELCGLSVRGYQKIEREKNDPHFSSILRIAAAYRLDLGDFAPCLPEDPEKAEPPAEDPKECVPHEF